MKRTIKIIVVLVIFSLIFVAKGSDAFAKGKNKLRVYEAYKTMTLKEIDGSFMNRHGYKYFKTPKKTTVKYRFFAYKGKIYHAGIDGKIDKGFKKIKGNYYFFDRDSGALARDTVVNDVQINQFGVCKQDDLSVTRMKTFMKARKIMEQVSEPGDTQADRRLKCFKWVISCRYKIYRKFKPTYKSNPDDWDVLFANDEFDKQQGDCLSDACAFAFLAVECGLPNVSICCDSGHAWCDVDGRLYDPLFAEANVFEENYNAKYTDYRKRAAYKKTL
ncbi:MAG: hypothetical protein IKQ71_11450 [Lachnospiraceae bacterium]|nr:hypothetical protein [Lachnospiraceae bacterium]